MADPFCPNCGTEVDEDARFCPTCGRTLALDESEELIGEPAQVLGRDDTAGEPEATQQETAAEPIPAAPAWPPPETPDTPEPPEPRVAAADEPQPEPEGEPVVDPAAAAPPLEARAATPPPPPPAPGTPPTTGAPDMPFTWPTTLSGWLIGGGSAFAALSLLPRLGNPLDLVLFVALLAISASIFVADRIPRVERQRLIVLLVLVLGLGVALERAAFTFRGIHTIFLIAMILAAGGALLIELDRDRPVPPLGGAS